MRRKHRGLHAFVTILVIVTAGFLIYKGPLQNVKKNVVGNVLKDQVMSKVESITGLSETQVQDIISVIPEEQQEQVIQIASDHITPSTVSKVMEYVNNKDADGLSQYAQSELSDEEISEVKTIVTENQDALARKMSEYGITSDKIASVIQEVAG